MWIQTICPLSWAISKFIDTLDSLTSSSWFFHSTICSSIHWKRWVLFMANLFKVTVIIWEWKINNGACPLSIYRLFLWTALQLIIVINNSVVVVRVQSFCLFCILVFWLFCTVHSLLKSTKQTFRLFIKYCNIIIIVICISIFFSVTGVIIMIYNWQNFISRQW